LTVIDGCRVQIFAQNCSLTFEIMPIECVRFYSLAISSRNLISTAFTTEVKYEIHQVSRFSIYEPSLHNFMNEKKYSLKESREEKQP
jgi:hypothetical protein